MESNVNTIKTLSDKSATEIINKEQFSVIPILIAKDIEEQIKIGKFLLLLDKHIELWERKLQLYLLKKKYYLNKLFFSKTHLSFLRFKEFNELWEINKLEDLGILNGAGVDKAINDNETKGKIINFTDVFHNVKLIDGYNLSDVTFSEKELKQYKIEKGDILLTPSSEDKINIGLSCLIDFNNTNNTVYSYHLNLFRPNRKIDNLFISYQLRTNRIKKYFYCVSQGVSRFTLSLENFKSTKIFLCKINEQMKISKFLSLLDKEIELLEKNISYLKNRKNFYISNMFI